MRVPRVRFTIRSLMLAVLVAALAFSFPPLLLLLFLFAFVLPLTLGFLVLLGAGMNVVVEAGFRLGEGLAARRARRRRREPGRLARAVPPGPRR